MTLHQAIEQILQENGKPMPAREIADLINQRKLYSRQDGAPVPGSQISARVKNYEAIFTRKEGKIGLVKDDEVSLGFEKYRREIKKEMEHLYKTGKGFNREEILLNFLNKIKNEELDLNGDEGKVSEPQAIYGDIEQQFKTKLLKVYQISEWFLSQNIHIGFFNQSFADIVGRLKMFQKSSISLFTGITGSNHFLLKLVADIPTSSFTVNPVENGGFLNEAFANLINSGNTSVREAETKIGFFVPTFGLGSSHAVPLEFKYVVDEIEERELGLDKALLVIPTGALMSNSKSFVEARRRLVQSKTLAGVINLPGKMMEGTDINLSLLIFEISGNQERIFFVDAHQIITDRQPDLAEIINSGEEIHEVSQKVISDTIGNSFVLSPIKYLSTALDFRVEEDNTVYEVGKLLVDKRTGSRFPDRKALYTGGEIKVIRVPDISFDTVAFKPTKDVLVGIDQDNLSKGRNILVKGGIALSAFNLKLKANVLPEEEQVLIDQNVYWIKPDPKIVMAEYLVGELLKPYVKDQVAYYSKGTGVIKLNFKDLLKIKVQIPSLEEQKEEIIKKFREEKVAQEAAVSVKELDFIKTLKHSLQQPAGVLGNDFTSLRLILDKNKELGKELKPELMNRMERAITDIEYILEQADHLIKVANPMKKGLELKSLLSKFPSEYQDVEIQVDGPEVQLSADPKQLRIMIHNFIHNAQKHGFKGIEHPKVWIEIIDVDEFELTIAIRNNGTSLPPEFTVEDFLAKGGSSSAEVGSGFGGFLIGQIVKNHNGSVILGRPETVETLLYNVEFIVSLSR